MAAAVLGAFTFALAAAGPFLLRRAEWVRRSPGWGIRAWQSLTLTVAAGVILTGLTLAVPVVDQVAGLAGIVGVSPTALTAHYGTPGGVALGTVALGSTLVLAAWLVANLIVTAVRGRIVRRRQVCGLAISGRPHPDGYIVLDSDTPSVYCLPGRGGPVVVTSSAKALLDEAGLAVVLAHERAHIESRHHRVVALSDSLRRTFRLVPPFYRAHEQIELLVEMQADDRAVVNGGRKHLAGALVALCLGAPRPALGVGGTDTAERIHRLSRLGAPARPWRARHTVVFIAVSMLVVMMPVVLAVAPAVEAAATHCCG